MGEKMLKVLMVPIYGEPYKCEIKDTLEEMQKIVCGNIEVAMRLSNNAMIIANEEGKILNMTPNRIVMAGWQPVVLRGNFFIVGYDINDESGDFKDLSDENIAKYTEEMGLAKCNGGKIFVRQSDDSWKSAEMEEEGESFIYYDLLQARIGTPYKFFGLDFAREIGTKVSPKDYKSVYHAATRYTKGMSPESICERLFKEHNLKITDRASHSMSVSDIVVLHLPEGDEYYYTDSFGFKKLEGFLDS